MPFAGSGAKVNQLAAGIKNRLKPSTVVLAAGHQRIYIAVKAAIQAGRFLREDKGATGDELKVPAVAIVPRMEEFAPRFSEKGELDRARVGMRLECVDITETLTKPVMEGAEPGEELPPPWEDFLQQLEPLPEEVPANLEFAANAPPNFEKVLPKAKDVTALEAKVAYAYVSSPTLAKQINRLMRAQSWTALASEYGLLVKLLLKYIAKVEKAYAAKRTLYRGMRLPEYHLKDQYPVGRIVTWHAFASVTTDRQLAECYTCEDYDRGFFADGVPVVFVINTFSRGAILGNWTPYASQHELLLAPFLCFRVVSASLEKRIWVVKLEVVKLRWGETGNRLVLLHPGSMPWATPQKEVLSELEEDCEEVLQKKLDPPGALLLTVFVVVLNGLLLFLYVAGYDLDDFSIS
ncbi:unnamed protein product [Effrenium voratum]|nr:unnamed protein product [Effrenium voratum]